MFEKKFKHIFWFDFETTGLDPWHSDPVQLSYILETEGEEVARRDLRMKPYFAYKCSSCRKGLRYDEVAGEGVTCPRCGKGVANRNASPDALKVIGKTFEEIMEFPDPIEALETLKADLKPMLTKRERPVCAGYNIKSFDMPFMEKWLYKLTNGSVKFPFYFQYNPYIDVLPIVIAMYYRVARRSPEKLSGNIKNMKLASAVDFAKTLVPNYFEGREEEEEKFHDALFDVEQTRDVFKSLLGV